MVSSSSVPDWPDFTVVDPNEVFRGVILITVPHMDDEALACGGTIARLTDKSRVHLVYVTDGTQAPEPVLPWLGTVSSDLGPARKRESVAAMSSLGVPESNLYFLDLPERHVSKHQQQLSRRLSQLIERVQPDHILTPFRYDRHRDHVALNRVVTAACRSLPGVVLSEYFVYYRWKLLPKGDIRRYIQPSELFQVDIAGVATAKRTALDCFKSQTTRFYAWQARPNLTAALLDGVSGEPETFLRSRLSMPGDAILDGPVTWIRLAHRIESPLKRYKDKLIALARRPLTAHADDR
jgi:LmbE family N-acetylglucosaminyl deacetylase